MMTWFGDKVFGKPEDKKDPRIDLVEANLTGLPPVTIINAQIDPLRSDGDLLTAALRKAGVKVEHKVYTGVTHEFFGMAAVVAKARQAQEFAGQALKKSFAAAISAAPGSCAWPSLGFLLRSCSSQQASSAARRDFRLPPSMVGCRR